ncbi:hypothetical protein EB118_09075 [bacterium]|nr:hypothetical protein [bacterium]NDD84044.1 hypothetical protein [bacterium]NDG30213.1 hypothetical protein [bacterium]
MSVATQNICPAILTSLSDNLINNSANVKIHGGTLAALTDPSNLATGNIIRQANDNGTGHSKEVRVVYKQRLTADDTSDTKSCDLDQNAMPYKEIDVPITQYRSVNFSMTEEQLRVYCDSYSSLVQLTGSNDPGTIVSRANGIGRASGPLSVVRELFNDFQLASNALIQAMNQDLLASIAGGFGAWYGQGGTIQSQTFVVEDTSTGSLIPKGLFTMKQAYMNSGFNGAPIIIGGPGSLQRVWMNDSRYFGQAANGLDYSTVRANTGIAEFYFDPNIITGSPLTDENSAVVFAPGSLLYLPYLQYVGNFGDIGTMKRFTMPMPGLPQVKVDCRILSDECSELYKVYLECYFDLFAAPTDMFKSTDDNYNINGVFEAEFTD